MLKRTKNTDLVLLVGESLHIELARVEYRYL